MVQTVLSVSPSGATSIANANVLRGELAISSPSSEWIHFPDPGDVILHEPSGFVDNNYDIIVTNSCTHGAPFKDRDIDRKALYGLTVQWSGILLKRSVAEALNWFPCIYSEHWMLLLALSMGYSIRASSGLFARWHRTERDRTDLVWEKKYYAKAVFNNLQQQEIPVFATSQRPDPRSRG